MKKVILILMMVLSVSAFAQGERSQRGERSNMSSEERANMMASRMTEQLQLNATQQEQLKKVFLKQAEERREPMGDRRQRRGENREQARSEMRKAFEEQRAAMEEKLKEILTEEQFKEWQSSVAEQRSRRNRNRN